MTAQVERVIVHLNGVPIGAMSFAGGDVVIAKLEVAPAFDAWAAEIRSSSEPLWRLGFLQPKGEHVIIDALAPSADHAFELRDTSGRSLAVDFVNVVASPRVGEPPVAVVYRRLAHAAVASLLRAPSRAVGSTMRPPAD